MRNFFQCEQTLCLLTFLHHILFEIQKSNLELQKEFITARHLYRIITSLQYKLKQQIDTSFFGIHCRQLLNRMPPETTATLKASFIQFISKFIEYIDKYFSKNVHFLEAMSFFDDGIENLTWNHIQNCIKVMKIDDLNEDNLFSEFTELKLTFESIKKKQISLSDQIRLFLSNETEKEIKNSAGTTQQPEIDEDEGTKGQTNEIR